MIENNNRVTVYQEGHIQQLQQSQSFIQNQQNNQSLTQYINPSLIQNDDFQYTMFIVVKIIDIDKQKKEFFEIESNKEFKFGRQQINSKDQSISRHVATFYFHSFDKKFYIQDQSSNGMFVQIYKQMLTPKMVLQISDFIYEIIEIAEQGDDLILKMKSEHNQLKDQDLEHNIIFEPNSIKILGRSPECQIKNEHDGNKLSQKHALFVRNSSSNQISIYDNESNFGIWIKLPYKQNFEVRNAMQIKTAVHENEIKCYVEKKPIKYNQILHKMYMPCIISNGNCILNTILKPCDHIVGSKIGLTLFKKEAICPIVGCGTKVEDVYIDYF